MSTELAERRKGWALRLFMIAGALIVAAAVTIGIEMRASRPDLATGPVVPGLSDSISGAQRIMITSAEASYRIERTERGWAMRDRGDYPVLGGRLAQLTDGLESLRFTRRMTSDPTKHARLGVDDPREGGRGILVQIEDSRGAFLVSLILGVETTGLYVRRPGEDQTWAAEGELPPLRDIAAWLDLAPLNLPAAQIARVEVMPASGPAYVLTRDAPDGGFTLIGARQQIAQATLDDTATAIAQVSPIDVQPAPAIQGAPAARLHLVTFAGVTVDAEIIISGDKTWLKMVARAPTPEQEQAALQINDRAAAWAYALSPADVERVAPTLAALMPAPAPAAFPPHPTSP
jgi:hypothetical protein